MQRCSIWTVSLAAALSLTGAAWAEHEGGGGHGPAAGHGTTPTFAKQRESDEAHEARESHSGAQNRGSAAGANFAARLAARVGKDPALLALLNSLGVTDVKAAAMGFRNLNQLVTALNVAKDTGIPFAKLQADITGGKDSLAQAILDEKPGADVKSIFMTARSETKTDLQTVRAAEDKTEDAKEAAKDKAEDAKEVAKDKAEDAKEGRSAAGANFAARLAARVGKDPALLALLNSLGVTDVNAAAMGFRNLNQLVTALHVAKDTGIPFAKLQADITGGKDSLAQAILDEKPGADVKSILMTARSETKTDLQTVRAAEDKAEDAKEAAQEAAEDAKEAAKEAAEEANEAAKAPTGTTATGSSPSTTKP